MHTNNLEHCFGAGLLPLLHLGELPEGLDRRGDLGAPGNSLGRALDVVEELLDEDVGGRVGERALAAAEPGADACFLDLGHELRHLRGEVRGLRFRVTLGLHILVLAVAQVLADAVDLGLFHGRGTHHADALGDEALDGFGLTEHLPVDLEQRQAAEVRVELARCFGGVKLRPLYGAEISGGAEGQTVAEVLVRRLGDGQHVARRLRDTARVEIGELHARIFHGGHGDYTRNEE
mmetsp:Transcript_84/g.226  ORF Transcript_84/g.226 Transcript_84/m.226 type:complete len:234 (-) Transcript_84:26-727(-)